MAGVSVPIKKMELDDKKLQAANEILKQTPAKTILRKPTKIFISWCERNSLNPYLVEELVDPFLTNLGFDVHYYKKDKRLGKPNDVINLLQQSCEITLVFYTKDDDSRPAENVIKEADRINSNRKVIFHEKGITIGSMTIAEALCIAFTRDKYEELLLKLVEVLKKNNLILL